MNSAAARRAIRTGAAGLAALLPAACAVEGPPPYAELSTSAGKLAAAEAVVVGAPASSELAAARAKLEAAEAAIAAGEHDRAWRLAVEAALDAELAEALARAEAAKSRLARQLAASDTTLAASFVRR